MLNWLKNRLWFTCNAANFKGIILKGDPEVRPTTWWNWAFLVFRGWKTEVVLEIYPDTDVRKYRIGFRSKNNRWGWKRIVPICGLFKVKIGREDVVFFALDHEGNEVVIQDRLRLHNNPNVYQDVQRI